MPSQHYTTIDKYMFDAGSYGSPTVSIYVALPNVGSIPRDNITCEFTPSCFDLIVRDLGGKSYRLVNDNLDNDIDPDKSKILVKADKVVVKLGKKKTEYGSYDHWSQLTGKKDKKKKAADAANPAAGIMDLMKQMYDEGDDNMKKMIGETMQKQREGKLGADGGMGGLGDMGDMGI
jgi:calcyclin binding protein